MNQRNLKFFFAIAAYIFVAQTSVVNAASPFPVFRTVALSGQQAPGTPAPGVYDNFDILSSNNNGMLTFYALLDGFAVGSNNTGIWSEISGNLSLVVREGDQAPGTANGVKFSQLDSATNSPFHFINSNGDTSFFSSLTGPGITSNNNWGIWTQDSGILSLTARKGSQAPGTSNGSVFYNLNAPLINDQGEVAFAGGFQQPTGEKYYGLWKGMPGSLSLLAQKSSTVGYLTDLVLSNSGLAAYREQNFAGGGTLWTNNAGVSTVLTKTGNQAPGTPSGVTFREFEPHPLVINSSGHVAFFAILQGPGIDDTNDYGIWSNASGVVKLIARRGAVAPNTNGALFAGTNTGFQMNDVGQTAFSNYLQEGTAGVTQENNSGIWAERNSSLSLIVREGDSVPGLPGTLFDSLTNSPRINNHGHIAFFGQLRNGIGGITASNDTGLWAEDRDGNLKLIVREGDLFEVSPNTFRTIKIVGGPSGFSDDYSLAFNLRFTDDSEGVFTATLVPEPSTWAMIVCCGIGICIFARHQRRDRIVA